MQFRKRSRIVVHRWETFNFIRQNEKSSKIINFSIIAWNLIISRDNRKSTESNSNSSDDPEGNPLNLKSSRKHLNTTAGKRRKPWKTFSETFWESCVETFRAFNSGNWNGGLRLLFLPCFVHWNYSIMLPSCIIFYSFEIFSEK